MTSFRLKVLACITMLIDHIGWILFPQLTILNIIGRLSFPIFAYLIAEGSTKTKNINSYFKRLLFFALLSQIPYSVAGYLTESDPFTLNIIFTLTTGLLLIHLIQLKRYLSFTILFLVLIILDFIVTYDYGAYGLLLILLSYLLIKKRIWGSLAIIVLTIIESIKIPVGKFYISEIDFGNQIFAILSLVPILLYKGEQGTKISKWFFYFFYPVHLIVLILIYILIK